MSTREDYYDTMAEDIKYRNVGKWSYRKSIALRSTQLTNVTNHKNRAKFEDDM